MFPLVDDWHLLLCNTAGMDQKDSFIVVVTAVAFARLVSLVSLLALCSLPWFAGPDAQHHGWYEPEGHVRSWWVLLVTIYLALYSRLVVEPRCSASWPVHLCRGGYMLLQVCFQRPIPMVFTVQKTIETLLLVVKTVIDVPVVWVVQVQFFFFSPLYLAVTCSAFDCGEQEYGIFWKMTSGWILYSALVGSTLDTCIRQFTEAFMVQTANCGVSAVAVPHGRRYFLSWCRGRFPWPCCSADHSSSPVAVLGQGDRWPCCAGRSGLPWSFTCPLCAVTGAWFRFAVAVHQQGCPHPCRGAELDPHGLADHIDSPVFF